MRIFVIYRFCRKAYLVLLIFTSRHSVFLTKEFWLFLFFGKPTWPLCLLSFVSLGIMWKPRIVVMMSLVYWRKNALDYLFIHSLISSQIYFVSTSIIIFLTKLRKLFKHVPTKGVVCLTMVTLVSCLHIVLDFLGKKRRGFILYSNWFQRGVMWQV